MKCLYCKNEIIENQNLCTKCGKKIPKSEFEFILSDLFRKGHGYNEILIILSNQHGIEMSLSTLKRRLTCYGLRRREPATQDMINNVVKHVENKLDGTGKLFGYRTMWHSLKLQGTNAPRDLVMNCMKVIDPDGVASRKSRKLKRRLYRWSPGPNFCWHIDGYDKLKPYGFPIHGCIDGFSRKLKRKT